MLEGKIDDYICGISFTIPEYPVFSVYDVERVRVYEKADIEKHLDNVNASVQRAIESGSQENYISELRRTACPYRGQPFTKDELVYDLAYAKKVVSLFRKVMEKDMERKMTPDLDPMMKKAVNCLLEHYKNTYQEATTSLVSRLRNDAIRLGHSFETAEEIGNEFMSELKKPF